MTLPCGVHDMTEEYFWRFHSDVFNTLGEYPSGIREITRDYILDFAKCDKAKKYQIKSPIKYSKKFMNNGLFVMQFCYNSSYSMPWNVMMWRHKQKYWNFQLVDFSAYDKFVGNEK